MSLAGLSLRDLEYVIAVAECGNFGRAAEQCNVSQPALSAQIKRLETLLGAVIFERTRKGVLLTRQGTAIVMHARLITAEARKLLASARSADASLDGPFKLGAIPTVGPYVLPYVLKPFRRFFPGMRLILSDGRTGALLEQLREGRLDAVLACGPVAENAFQAEQLFHEPFLIAHPPHLKPEWPLTGEGQNLVLLEEGHCLRDQALAACGPIFPEAIRHATGLDLLRHMVAAGEGLSLMPALAARTLGPIEGVLAYTPAPPGQGRDVVFVTRASDPRVSQFAQLCGIIKRSVPPPAAVQETARLIQLA